MNDRIPHGTNNGYRNYGCRCDGCKLAGSIAGKAEYQRNKAQKATYAKRYRQDNADQIKSYRESRRHISLPYSKKYYEDNKSELLAKQREYYNENSGRIREANRAWVESHRERHREYQRQYQQSRRVLKAALPTFKVSDRDWRRLQARYHHSCAYCACASEKVTMDHVVPLVRGGGHSIGNLLPACQKCNSSKGHKLLVEWMKRSV